MGSYNDYRRNFLKWLGNAGTAVAVAEYALLRNRGEEVRANIREDWTPKPLEPFDDISAGNRSRVERLLGINYQSIPRFIVAGGREHYLYEGWHHDNEWAATELIHALPSVRQTWELDSLERFEANGSYALCGSPTSNLRAAAAMQYLPIDPTIPKLGFRRTAKPVLNLPIEYELDAEFLIDAGYVFDKASSKEGDATPLWGLRYRGTLIPTIPGQSDFLLISRLPNWFVEDFDEEESGVVTIFGGCTGAGTSAVWRLIRDDSLLHKLDVLTSRYKYWQAVVQVSDIRSLHHPIKGDTRWQAHSLPAHLLFSEPVTFT